MTKYINHLSEETSPYLLQHAGNPVDWYPWNEVTLQKARREDKPILLSIGYAACHWCHVMAHESFEDDETAKIMNEHFICIKVDREERPDIDKIYMTYVQMTTGSGGWPLNVFLTPNLEPFYGGTYFPAEEHYGKPSWKKILQSVHNYYENEKERLQQNLEAVRNGYNETYRETAATDLPGKDVFESAVKQLSRYFDPIHGGLGSAPKFPAIQPLSAFLRYFKNTGNREYLNMVTFSLEKMAKGGIYDHIGGGFSRYSVDNKWLIPHFEKMLYDNAQLCILFLDAFQATKSSLYKNVVHETLNFIIRELTSPDGGFYSSLDADSEGEEGKYYVWTKPEVDLLPGKEFSAVFCDYYDVTEHGNFENKNILHIQTDISSVAKRYSKTVQEIEVILNSCREILLQVRQKRVRPGLDDKILTSWNGLMLSAFARAYQSFGTEPFQKVIENNINFFQKKMYKKKRLFRTYNHGKARFNGFLEDYAFYIQGLLDAYEAQFKTEYLEFAFELLEITNREFWDGKNFGYYFTAPDSADLLYRIKDEHDESIPSGTGVMLLNLLRCFSMTENKNYLTMAENILRKYHNNFRHNPYAFASYLQGLDFYLSKPKEIVLVESEKGAGKSFLEKIFRNYLPNKVVMLIEQGQPYSLLSSALLKGKTTNGKKIAAYVCHNFSCSPPVYSAEEFLSLLTGSPKSNDDRGQLNIDG